MDAITHPAPTLRYYLLDVFTENPFTGNPLAVFVDPEPLSDGQMQRIAAELGLSETVFVWSPPRIGEPWRTRIFTPAVELPFAGHPTVGAAFLLASLGLATSADDTIAFELAEAVGTVPVTVALDQQGIPIRADLVVPRPPEAVPAADPSELAAVVGLRPSDLHPHLPVRGYSAGNPFSIIPVIDSAALAKTTIDTARWERSIAGSAAPHLYVVTPMTDTQGMSQTWRARMFAPAMGITEDPATGAAAAAFAGYIAEIDPSGQNHSILIEQGIEMGRPSVIHLTISAPDENGRVVVGVGGPAVVIGNGVIAAPRPR